MKTAEVTKVLFFTYDKLGGIGKLSYKAAEGMPFVKLMVLS